MAFEIPGFTDGTRVAGGDLSAKQYHFVKLNNSGQVVIVAANTDKPYGVLQNAPASGATAEVMLMGISKVVADADLAIGDQVGSSADGQAATYAPGTDTTKYVVGEVLTANTAAAGIVSIAFNCLGAGRGA